MSYNKMRLIFEAIRFGVDKLSFKLELKLDSKKCCLLDLLASFQKRRQNVVFENRTHSRHGPMVSDED